MTMEGTIPDQPITEKLSDKDKDNKKKYHDTKDNLQQKTGEVIDEAQEKVKDVAGQVQGQLSEQITTQKTKAAEAMGSVANMVRMGSDQLRQNNQDGIAQYTDGLAENLENISTHLRDRDLGELVNEVEDFARRQPMLFLGGAFALGVVAARFIKSSGSQAQSSNMSAYDNRSRSSSESSLSSRYGSTTDYDESRYDLRGTAGDVDDDIPTWR